MDPDGSKIKLNMSSKLKSCNLFFNVQIVCYCRWIRSILTFFSSFRILGEVKLDLFPKFP